MWTPGVERIALHRTTCYTLFFCVYFHLNWTRNRSAGGGASAQGGGASAQRHARAWRPKVQQKRPTRRAGDLATARRKRRLRPRALRTARAHGTAPPQLPRDPATSVLHAFTHQSVGEYCGEVGLYSGDLALLVPAPSVVGLYCGLVGLYCGEVGLYCGEVGEYDGEVGEYDGEVGE